MASNRNHRVAVTLMNRSISQRGKAMSGREMRIALSQHRHRDGSPIAECVIQEYVGWAEQRRRFFEKKDRDAEANTRRLSELKAHMDKLKQEQDEADRLFGGALSLAQASQPKFQRAIAMAVAMSHALLGRRDIKKENHRFAARGA